MRSVRFVFADVTQRTDVVFQGEGLGEYSLCFTNHPTWGAARLRFHQSAVLAFCNCLRTD